MSTEEEDASSSHLTYGKLLTFFVPLGASASLMALSPVIINSTLARSPQPEQVIATFALATSLMVVTETPAILLRKASSALVRDRDSYRAMLSAASILIGAVVLIDLAVSFTPVGNWIFGGLLGVEASLLPEVRAAYRILLLTNIFSAIRCLYQGIIIVNLRTTWLTVGTGIRLAGMFLLAWYLLRAERVTSGATGALLFCVGMGIEAGVSLIKGRSIVRHTLPAHKEGHEVRDRGQVFAFYFPLLYATLITAVLGPITNGFLSQTNNPELAIASYAIAANLGWMMRSFFFYMHQIVIQFHRIDPVKVFRFNLMMSLVPGLLTALLGFTPLGPRFLQHLMGMPEGVPLIAESLWALRIFLLVNLIFPWFDYANGILMVRGRTKVMFWSQVAFIGIAVPVLFALTRVAPGWNGMIGAVSQAAGFAGATAVVLYMLKMSDERSVRVGGPPRRGWGKGVAPSG